MHAYKLLLVIFIVLPFLGWSQREGCTSPDAMNFDSLATTNDGTCQFEETSFRPKTVIRKLPKVIAETSGLIYWDGFFWTHNDSGGESAIYKIDSTRGKVRQVITLIGAVNKDWEEISHDDDFIYLGDFGNNGGDRRDLAIYKIAKSNIPIDGDAEVQVEKILFTYGDQKSYTTKYLANDYDCEAMISFGDSLYLFSKNWADLSCRLYAIPKEPGSYNIFPLDEFYSGGMVTGGAIEIGSKQLVLTGYKDYVPFIWIFDDYWRNDFFGGNRRKIIFPTMQAAQTEAIASTSKGIFFISCERTIINKARLFRINLFNYLSN